MLKDFKDFAVKGNVIDMAVGLVIGAAFGAVVKSFVDNVMMPPLGLLTGGVDFKNMAITLKEGVAATGGAKAIEPVLLKYGLFINEIITFVLVTFAIFIVVKKLMAAKKEEEAAPAPAEPPAQEVLLSEIRDLLKK